MKKSIREYFFWDLDLFLLLLLACFAVAFLIDSRTYNQTAALFPRIVASATLLLLIGAGIQRIWKIRHTEKVPAQPQTATESTPTNGGLKWYYNLAVMLVYFLSIYLIGLTWASLLFLLVAPFLLGYKKFKIIAVVAVSWIVFFVYIFSKLLYIRIPAGIIGEFIHKL